MKKFIISILILAAIGGLGWLIHIRLKDSGSEDSGRGGGGGGGDRSVAVEVQPIQLRTLRQISRFSGSLAPRSSFIIAPKISGRLGRLAVEAGDRIATGSLIAELDDDEYRHALDQSRAELAVARAQASDAVSSLTVAARDYERITALFDKEIASESERDGARARFQAAQAKHEVALAEITRREAALKAAETRLTYATIQALWPDDGTLRIIGERFVDQGSLLQTNSPIVSILDDNTMLARIDIIERDYSKIHPGQRAIIRTDAFLDREFHGTVLRVAPVLQAMSRQALVEIEIPNPEHLLRPGMFVRVEVEFSSRAEAVAAPLSAIARRDGQPGVFLIDRASSKVRYIPVTLGISEGAFVEILSPEITGEVVTLGHHLLSDGGAIRLYEAGSEKTSKKRQEAP